MDDKSGTKLKKFLNQRYFLEDLTMNWKVQLTELKSFSMFQLVYREKVMDFVTLYLTSTKRVVSKSFSKASHFPIKVYIELTTASYTGSSIYSTIKLQQYLTVLIS